MFKFLKKLFHKETWEEQCEKMFCSNCEYYEDHKCGLCHIEYTTGKCFKK